MSTLGPKKTLLKFKTSSTQITPKQSEPIQKEEKYKNADEKIDI